MTDLGLFTFCLSFSNLFFHSHILSATLYRQPFRQTPLNFFHCKHYLVHTTHSNSHINTSFLLFVIINIILFFSFSIYVLKYCMYIQYNSSFSTTEYNWHQIFLTFLIVFIFNLYLQSLNYQNQLLLCQLTLVVNGSK